MWNSIDFDRKYSEYTTMTLENESGRFEVSLAQSDLNIYDLMQFIVKPTLLAAGYSEKLVGEYIDD